MKRAGKIILIIVLVLLLLLAGLVIWQRENIRAALTMLTTDSETIAQQAEQTREESRKKLEEEYQVTVQQPSAKQSEDLLMGNVDPEQVKEELGLTEKAEASIAAPTADNNSQKEILEKYVAKLYAKKVDLMAKLGEYRDEVYDEWNALSEEERTDEKKESMILEGLTKCYNLESAVDEEVMQIVDECKSELKKIGADTSAADTLWSTYEKEKLTEKAYYMDKYVNN